MAPSRTGLAGSLGSPGRVTEEAGCTSVAQELQTLRATLRRGLEGDADQARAGGETSVPQKGTASSHVS
eukprot:1317110-Alexandrium_andersonii.AAC.1